MTPMNVILQAAEGGNSNYMSFLMMGLIFVIFYFFMIRPQSKKQKELQRFREALKVGDKIVTAGGIYGKIKEVKDNVVYVEIAENVRIRIAKTSVFASPEEATDAPAKS